MCGVSISDPASKTGCSLRSNVEVLIVNIFFRSFFPFQLFFSLESQDV